jgi:hypothetical protein
MAGALTGCGFRPVTPVATCAGGPPECGPGSAPTCTPLAAYPEGECRYLPRGNSRVGTGSGTAKGFRDGAAVLCEWKCVGSPEGEP